MMTTSTLLITAAGIGAVLGAAFGWLKSNRPIAGVFVGASVCVLIAFLFFRPPAKTIAVETPVEFDEEVLRAEGPVLVDFYADWCPPCRQLSPIIDELAKEYRGEVKFVKLNVDKAPTVLGWYGIRSIPTVIIFQKSQPVQIWVGCQMPDTYRRKLDAILTGS